MIHYTWRWWERTMERSHIRTGSLSFFFAVACATSHSQSTFITSVVQVSASVADMAIDGSGNTYVVGTFAGSLTLGDLSITSGGGGDAYVACLAPNADWIWATRIGGISSDGGTTVTVNDVGDLFVTAYIGGGGSSLSIGSVAVPGFPNSGLAVMRMNTAGELVWVVDASVEQLLNIESVAANDHVCYIGGTAFDHALLQFGPYAVGTTEASGFLAACNGEGEWLWAKEYQESVQSSCDRIIADPSGDLIATGQFAGPTLVLDGSTLTGPPLSPDLGAYLLPYVGRWSSGGEVQWLVRGDVGADGDANTTSLSAAPNGGVAITGTYVDSLDFGSDPLTEGAFYMATLDATGGCSMAMDIQPFGAAFSPADAVQLDDGTMLQVGYFLGDVQLGALQLIGNGQVAGFLGQFSPDDGWIQAESVLSTDQVSFHRVARNAAHVRAFGRFEETMSVGDETFDADEGNWFIAFVSPSHVGVREHVETPTFTLHPNPAHDRISGTITDGSGETLLRIFGSLGNEVIAQRMQGPSFDMDLSGLAPGVYTARAGRSVSRFVKE